LDLGISNHFRGEEVLGKVLCFPYGEVYLPLNTEDAE